MHDHRRALLVAWVFALLAAVPVSGAGTLKVVASDTSFPDSVITTSLGVLPGEFSDRFITDLESIRDSSDIHIQTGRRVYSSADGLHLAFRLSLITSHLMIADGVRGDTYGFVSRGVYSSQGGHFAYFAGPSERAGPSLVVDGRRIAPGVYAAGPLALSADGRHWAFVGRAERDATRPTFVVTDRGTGEPYDAIGRLTLSWDGERIGYVARKWGDRFVVIDGVRSPRYDQVTAPVFDLSGEHVAYAYRVGSSWRIVRDDETIGPYQTCDTTSVRWNRDGSRLAYVAGLDGVTSMFFVNGEPGKPWPQIAVDSTCFSPDGAHTLYWVGPLGTPVLDGEALETHPAGWPGTVVWSAGGKHMAYTQWVAGSQRSRVVRDGIAGPDYDAIGTPRLSADGSRLAYAVRRGDDQCMFVDGALGPYYRSVGSPAFSPDGRHVAYFARPSGGKAFVVVDGRRGPEFEWVPRLGPTYLPDGSLQYLAVRRSELFRVTHVPRRGD